MAKIKNCPIIFLVLLALILRILFLSHWLEDWDSVQFALALHHYSLINELPHPPGYPLYILLGKIFLLIFKDDNLSLTLISALLGSLSTIPLYFLSKEMFNKTVALISVILFMFMPISWTLSEVALTNIPGLFFELLIIWGIYHFRENNKKILILSALSGLCLGMRFTEASILVFLLGFIVFRKGPKFILLTALSFIIGLSLWLFPLILISTPNLFIKAYSTNALYILHHDSQLNQSLPIKHLLIERAINLWSLLSIGFTPIFLIIGLLSLIYLLKNYRQINFLLIWLIAYLIPLGLFFNLQVTRYTLPLLPPLSIIVSLAFFQFKKSKMIYLLFGIVIIIISKNSFSQVKRFHDLTPPIILSSLFVKQNFSPQSILIIPTYTKRHFEYYDPSFRLITPDKLNQALTINPKTIITDTDTIKDQIIQQTNYRLKQTKIFEGDYDIYTRTPKVTIYVLQN